MSANAGPVPGPPPVWLREDSRRARFGFKGAGAPAWCAAAGLPLPVAPNTWAALEDGDGLIARLAYTEFYVEHGSGERIAALRDALGRGLQVDGGGVYPVHRRDVVTVLGGALAQDVLVQVCNVNFGAIDAAAAPVIMTLMLGVAVTVLPAIEDGAVIYRVACDPTFAPYLRRTLADIAVESGGAAPLA